MTEILHRHLPHAPWADPRTRRLPGIQPIAPGDWLRVDEAHAGQMAARDRLIAARPEAVHALAEKARPAAEELLARVLSEIETLPGYRRQGGQVLRPDGVSVPIDRTLPLLCLGRLVQEDFCLLERPEGAEEHILTGAILCFPASWSLAEKFGRPLVGIHRMVPAYDPEIGKRVQRLFDAIRPDQGLWRANALRYQSAELHHPRTEAAPRPKVAGAAPYLRSERQCLIRLPQSGAVVFSIHTYLLRIEDLSPEQAASLAAHPVDQAS